MNFSKVLTCVKIGYHYHMNPSYLDPQNYLQYLDSPQGQIQQKMLAEAIIAKLPNAPQDILDLGCGSGWLAGALTKLNFKVTAVDSSEALIKLARSHYPNIEFTLADATNLPFPHQQFDLCVANMVMHDIDDLPSAFINISNTLKTKGLLLATIPNPYLAFPVGVWKRGLRKLFGGVPKLKLLEKVYFQKRHQSHEWRPSLKSYFYTLSDYLQASHPNFIITDLIDIESKEDSNSFNLYHQLHRFPVIWMIMFKKLL